MEKREVNEADQMPVAAFSEVSTGISTLEDAENAIMRPVSILIRTKRGFFDSVRRAESMV